MPYLKGESTSSSCTSCRGFRPTSGSTWQVQDPDPKILPLLIPNFPQIILDMLAMFWTFGFVASFHGLLMPYLKEAMKKQGQ